MTLKSGQDAAKMRQDGPDEPFGSFISAKMAPLNPSKWNTNWLKNQQKESMKKEENRITIGSRSDHRNSEVDPDPGDAVASLPTPYPFSSGQPWGDSSHL